MFYINKKCKGLSLISILFLIFILSVVPAVAADDSVNITYVGFESSELSLTTECFGLWMTRHVDTYYDFVNYNYVNGYDKTEFGIFIENSASSQDIIILDMIVLSESMNDELLNAKQNNEDLVIIDVHGSSGSSIDLTDTELEHLLSYGYRVPTSTSQLNNPTTLVYYDIRSMTYLIMSHLLVTYTDNIDDFDFSKTKVLYVGYDTGDMAPRLSGTYGFNVTKSMLWMTHYSEYFDMESTTAVSYGTVPEDDNGDPVLDLPFLEDDSWHSADNLRKNMSARNLNFSDYDIIIFDGFFNNTMMADYSEIFEEAAKNPDIAFYFVGSFNPYVKPFHDPDFEGSGLNAMTFGTTGENKRGYRVLNYPDVENLLITTTSSHFDGEPTSSSYKKQINGTFLYPSDTHGKIFAQTGIIPDHNMYLPEGDVFHPDAKQYFKTVDAYVEWYEESSYYKEGMPYIGVFGYSNYNSDIGRITAELESKGYNVIAFSTSNDHSIYDRLGTEFINDETGECYVSCFISIKNWALVYDDQPDGVRQLEELNVPVIKLVGYEGWSIETMYDVNSGFPEDAFSWMVSSSNLDGMTDFIALNPEHIGWIADRAIAWAELKSKENAAKEVAIMYYNYPPGKEDIGANYLNVMRSLAGDGAKARVTAGNSRIAITDPRDTTNGYIGIIRELEDESYNVSISHLPVVTIEKNGIHSFKYGQDEHLILNEENLINLIYSQGINVGSYAPGVLDTMVQERIDFMKQNPSKEWWGAELIPVKDYLEWLEHETTPVEEGGNGTMSKELYDELMKTWGIPTYDGAIPDSGEFEAWGGMIWKDKNGQVGPKGLNYVVIPMVKFGDVRIMPEPNRALASDKALDSASYHSGDLPPTHQYVAFYMWLNRGTGNSTGSGTTGFIGYDNWKADAVVHFGTHGTQEWLPGTSVGLSRTKDWGPVLLPDLPNIYPYIVANVGEGLTAEYRGNALIISHMTPPMIKTTLYDELVDMESAIRGYQKQNAGAPNEAILGAYRQIIMENLYSMGWQNAFVNLFNSYKQTIVAEEIKMEGGETRPYVNNVTDADVQYYLSSNKDVFDVFLENYLHNFVESIRETSLSYGTHTYGAFDEKQVAPMVWNMWSRQGLDDVLLDTYFKGADSIPTNTTVDYGELFDGYDIGGETPDDINFKYTEDDVLKFVEKVVGTKNNNQEYVAPSADELRTMLDSTFKEDKENKEYQDKVIYFLLGPSAYFTDSVYPDSSAVIGAWKSTTIDGVSIYDSVKDDLCDFYFYHSVPTNLASKTGEGHKAADDTILTDEDYETFITAIVDEILSNSSYSTDPYHTIEKALSRDTGVNTTRPWYHQEMVYTILGNDRISYAENLRACGPSEMNALLNSLSGGYVSPSPGNDPVLNPHALPTGRNFYGVDPTTYPTPAAWRVGQVIGEQVLQDYYTTNGEFPTTVSFMRFGVDYIQDEATLEATLFYLLGCEPEWYKTGKLKEVTPVRYGDDDYDDMFLITVTNSKGKTETIYRPRVDVVYNSAGMRDGYGSMLRHIDKAIKAVAQIDDDPAGNNIRENSLDLYSILTGKSRDDVEKMLKEGTLDPAAWDLATSRTFAQELGTYEIGTGNLVSASGNITSDDQDSLKAIADLYLAKMGFLYTESNWGGTSEDITKMLQALLGRTDASIFASAGNLYDSLDNDDVYQYFGIMNMVSSMYDKDGNYIENRDDWKTPQMYIADTSNIHNYKSGDKMVMTASEYIQKDLAARYLNPEWVQGQMEAGYSGAALMAEFLENIYGWAIATNGEIIGQETWDKIFEMYTSDEITDWLSNTSPYALQSINARMVEAIRTGMWSPDFSQIVDLEEREKAEQEFQSKLEQMVENYVKSVIESGVACCHHTCGNPTFDGFVQGMLATLSPDVLTDEQKEQYLEIVKEALEEKPPQKALTESKSSGSGVGMASVLEVNTDPNTGDEDEGEDSQAAHNPGVGLDGTVTGTPTTTVTGFEMTVSKVASTVRDFIQNPTFSTSSLIAIAFVVLVVGAVFYGSRKKNI